MDREMGEISDYLGDSGFSLRPLFSKKGREVIDYLRGNNVDLMLTDKNLGNTTGMDIVKEVRKNHFLTDILYYSGVSIDDSDILALKKYFSVEVLGSRDIVPTTKKLIDKNIQKWEDIVFLRGMLISKIIELEQDVDTALEKYFKIPEGSVEHFRNFILNNTYYSFEGKKQTLEKIFTKNTRLQKFDTVIKKLEELGKNRNNLAHCKTSTEEPNCLIKMGSPYKYTKKEMGKLLKTSREAKQQLEELISEL